MTSTIQQATPLRLREVLPRDGFQDLASFVPTSLKIEIIRDLYAAGCRWIEVTSFVHPRQVPQFIDAEQITAALRDLPDLVMSSFVPNRHGLQRALTAGIDEVSVAVATTDRLADANFRRSRSEVITEAVKVAQEAAAADKMVSVTIGGAFGCPFEGSVDPELVIDIAQQIASGGVDTIFLADTTGSGTPQEIRSVVARVVAELPGVEIGIHIHGITGIDSVRSAVSAGATIVDTSMGGFGGCPFVPDAPGNVDTAVVAGVLAEMDNWVGPELSSLKACASSVRMRLGSLDG